MTSALRKGWCPGVLRPMPAGDGLIVRLRPTGGIVTAKTARALADLATRHGNGRFELTSRANLQMRGIDEAGFPALEAALRALDLVDVDAAGEAARNVVASPLAGLQRRLDIRPLVAALERRLANTPRLHALPAKFGFLIDDGGSPSLADIAADVRFDWCAKAGAFAVGLGGTRAEAVLAGHCLPDDLVDTAEAIARGAIGGFARVPDARRMHALVAGLGAAEVVRLCGTVRADTATSMPLRPDTAEAGSSPDLAEADVPTLTASFGSLDAGMLRVAAELAFAGLGELRLTPWRSLLLPGADPRETRLRGERAGWIVDDTDPRLAVAACVGAPACERATTPTRKDAEALADLAAALSAGRPALHVSGCAKGCAHAVAASVVLIGRDGRYDLVRDGRPGDAPALRGLDLAEARSTIAALRPR